MDENGKIRVLIADDHAVVRQGLKQILSRTEDVVVIEEVENGKQVLERLADSQVDVVVMDIEMPEMSGWEVLTQLKQTQPRLPVLILSIYSEDVYGVRFLKAGASGYLTKSSAPEQLVEAIRTVSRGGKFVGPALAEKLIAELGQESDKPLHETLSTREFQVFCMLSTGKSIKSIAGELSVSSTTVSTHRARILEKMNMTSTAELIHYAYKNGLVT